MPAFFPQRRGQVVRVDTGHQAGVLPFAIRMRNIDIGGAVNPTTKAIITQAGIVENGNFQILHALDETINATIFGDRIGEFRVSGIAFSSLCGQKGSGMGQVIDAYVANRLSSLGGPVLVSLGTHSYRGLLTGMTLDIVDGETQLGQWTYRFLTVKGTSP